MSETSERGRAIIRLNAGTLWGWGCIAPQGVNFKIVTYGHMSGVTRFL